MENPVHKRSFFPTLALSLAWLLPAVSPALAADDQLRQTAQAYSETAASINTDLSKLSAMDQQCITQTVVYDPSDMSSHSKALARTFKPAEMARMDAAVQQLGQQLALGKSKLDETVKRINAARDAMEKLTPPGAIKVAGVDGCSGADAAQTKVLEAAEAQIGSAKSILSLDAATKKQPKISTIIETFRSLVTEKSSQAEFGSLIKACAGPSYATVDASLRSGLAKLGKLQGYATSIETSVDKMSASLTAQSAGIKKQVGCKNVTPGDPATAPKAKDVEKPVPVAKAAVAAATPVTDPKTAAKATGLTDAPLPPEKPLSMTASQRIQSQGTAFTSAPAGVPAADALAQCYADPCSRSQVRSYQTAINQYIKDKNLPITPIATDGVAGTQTANAWRAVMGNNNANTSTTAYTSWGAKQQTTPSGVYYTFPPAKLTSPSQLANFFQ